MEPLKPLKRDPAIVEFSKDHHFALLLIWKIREGLKKSIDIERINKYVIHFFDTDLQLHFKEEEELLFSKISPDNSLRIQAETEHQTIYKMIADLKTNISDKETLQSFTTLLESHIRFEERQLFNYLQQNISESELAQIATDQSPRDHDTDSGWEDIFWK